MKKTLLFLTVLTFIHTTEGAKRKQAAERILQYYQQYALPEKKENENKITEDKIESNEAQVIIEKPEESVVKEKNPVNVWVGYSNYAMNEFNRKLSREGNKTIDGGLNAGIEIVSEGYKIKGIPLSRIPIGIEYLEARSRTTHTGNGSSTTVDWELPLIGFYFWPEVQLTELSEKWMDGKGLDLRLRPVGIGYYTLGKIVDAELDVSDTPGYLKVEDETIAIMSQIGLKYVNENKTFEAFVESGYRWLKFTSVMREPKNGFSDGPPSTMPEDLDYSGFIIKGGLRLRY